MFQKVFLGFILGFSILLNGCVIQPVNGSSQEIASTVTSEYGQPSAVTEVQSHVGGNKLQPLDPIYIRFSGILEQQQLELTVDENGEINLLHIQGPIKAAGLTASELEQKIEHLYVTGGIYKNVSVNVTMTAKVYYVHGEVNSPGQFQLMSGTTLLQAIAGARGLSAFANKKKVTITRHGKIYTYNIKDIEKYPSKDVKLEAGDVIKAWQQWY
jgi:protein involved in polysaccharide export with SLBB domain